MSIDAISDALMTSVLLIGIPAALWSLLAWVVARKEVPERPTAALTEWKAGFVAIPLGLVSTAAWMSWTAADHDGHPVPPGLPAPTSFPTWQVLAFALTLIVVAAIVALRTPRICAGAIATAVGLSAGVALALVIDIEAHTESSQGGVGVMIASTVGTAALIATTGLIDAVLHSSVAVRRGANSPADAAVRRTIPRERRD